MTLAPRLALAPCLRAQVDNDCAHSLKLPSTCHRCAHFTCFVRQGSKRKTRALGPAFVRHKRASRNGRYIILFYTGVIPCYVGPAGGGPSRKLNGKDTASGGKHGMGWDGIGRLTQDEVMGVGLISGIHLIFLVFLFSWSAF